MPALIRQAGFQAVQERIHYATLWGTLVPASDWPGVQEADHGWRILLGGVRDGLLLEPLVKQLQPALAAQGVTVPYLKIESVPVFPRPAAGQAPLIRSNRPVAAPGAPGLLVG